MVKYGNVPEDQALAMITINPARELGLDRRLGSIEVGKDADIAIFNAHPFDGFARCELALIDGEVQFQRKSKDGKLAPRPGDHAAMPAAAVHGRRPGQGPRPGPRRQRHSTPSPAPRSTRSPAPTSPTGRS